MIRVIWLRTGTQWDCVNTDLSLRVPQNVGKFSTSWSLSPPREGLCPTGWVSLWKYHHLGGRMGTNVRQDTKFCPFSISGKNSKAYITHMLSLPYDCYKCAV